MLKSNNPGGAYTSYRDMKRDYPMFTHTGIHDLLGMPANQLTDYLNMKWLFPIKFVEVDINWCLHISSLMPRWVCRIYRDWQKPPFHSDGVHAFVYTRHGGNALAAAIDFCNIMAPEHQRLADDPHADYWLVEAGNEHGLDPVILDWLLEIARELQRRYKGKVMLAAMSMCSGCYNEPHTWDMVIEHLLAPAFREGLRVVVSLHAYSSGIPEYGNTGGYQHAQVTKHTDRWTVPPRKFSFDENEMRQGWTGFAPGWVAAYVIKRMKARFANYQNHDFELAITESYIDRQGAWSDGTIAGGHWEWNAIGAYDFNIRQGGVDDLLAEGLWRYELFYQSMAEAGVTIHAITPFTLNDGSGNWKNFIVASLINPFVQRVRNYQPAPAPEEPPSVEGYSYCVLATRTTTRVRYRSAPDWHDASNIKGDISPTRVYRIHAYTINADGERWFLTEVMQGVKYWICDAALDADTGKYVPIVRYSNDCDVPEYQEEKETMLKIGGSYTDFGKDKINGTLGRDTFAMTRHVGWSSASIGHTGFTNYYLEGHYFKTKLDSLFDNHTPDDWSVARNYFLVRQDEWLDEQGKKTSMEDKWALEWFKEWGDIHSLDDLDHNVYYMAYWAVNFPAAGILDYVLFERQRMIRLQRLNKRACVVNVYLDQFTTQYQGLVQTQLSETIVNTGSALGLGIRGSLASIGEQIKSLSQFATWGIPIFIYEIQPDEYPANLGAWIAYWNYLLNQLNHVKGAAMFAWHSDNWHSEWSGQALTDYIGFRELEDAPGSDEPPETDPGNGMTEPGKPLILRIIEAVFNFILGLFRRN